MQNNEIYAVVSSQNCGPFLKVSGVLGLQEYLGPGYIEKILKIPTVKGQVLESKQKESPIYFTV